METEEIRIPVRRIHKGNITVPDFIVDKCIKENREIYCVYKDQTMTLTPQSLLQDKLSTGPKKHVLFEILYTSNDFRYALCYYKWNPDDNQRRS